MKTVFNEIEHLDTESRNIKSESIDQATTSEIIQIINDEDKKCAIAVEQVKKSIEEAVDLISSKL